MGASAGYLADVGIDDDIIRTVRAEVKGGTSVLFVMSGNVVPDRVLGEFPGTGAVTSAPQAPLLSQPADLCNRHNLKLRRYGDPEAAVPRTGRESTARSVDPVAGPTVNGALRAVPARAWQGSGRGHPVARGQNRAAEFR
jgi:hypothetical protein